MAADLVSIPQQTPPIILSIAGYDPSAGAGVAADVKTIHAHSCYAVACITAITVQSTTGIRRVYPQPAAVISQTLRELAYDVPIAAVRVGMLATAEIAGAVADFLEEQELPNVVVDPVLQSSSGTLLLHKKGIEILKTRLIPLAKVLTPNIEEAAVLSGLRVSNLEEMKTAALVLHSFGAGSIVIKGGHLEEASDLISIKEATGKVQASILSGPHIASRATHGTGCAFASALACNLGFGHALPAAAENAKSYVTRAIQQAYPVGKGIGPINHFYNFKVPSTNE